MTIADTIETIVKHANIVMDTTIASREDWLAKRREGIGGSDCAAALGMSPWRSPYSLFEEKANGLVDDVDNERMEWGRRLEGPIVQAYGERTTTEVQPYPVMLRSRDYPWMQVNLDAVAPDTAIEAKNVGLRMAGEWNDGAVPDHYLLQGCHELAVTGLSRVVFAVLIGGQELRMIEVERDDTLIADVIEQEHRFWEMVTSNTAPAIDGSDSTSEALKLRYAHPEPGAEVDLVPDLIQPLLETRAHLKAEERYLKGELSAVENQIKSMLGDAEIGTVDGIAVVTWKRIERAGYVVAPTEYRAINIPKTRKGK